ncbi:MAG: 2-C-methyl-D-erythritol 4-phosphate cytidylyltransferase [Actinobacteria bacterium]|nr:2-C-methyl-D-erythritol 4-phosphate cytidylyltransferase [Actinomycetota bacterium]
MEPVVALVVAAGSGTRLGGNVPKALREVGGRPLVLRSIEALAEGGVDRALVVVAPGLEPAFEGVLADAPVPSACVAGGAERQDSVRAGLAAIAGDPGLSRSVFVLVHDAARALVPAAVVRRVIDALRAGAVGCIPVVPLVDTVRRVTPSGSTVVDRAELCAVQTPQGFVRARLEEAHRVVAERGIAVTDDAAALEVLGETVALVEGSREALKVTEPIDLMVAEAVVRSRS